MKRTSVGAHTRPVCVHCGKLYGKRDTTDTILVWRKGEERPPYRGNGVIVAESEFAALYKIQEALGRPLDKENDRYVRLEIWDGQTWCGGYQPFCTLRCALGFARKAFRAGYRPQQLEKTK
jgi:hypothetical protein